METKVYIAKKWHTLECLSYNISILLKEMQLSKNNKIITIGICGDGALGKTTLASQIQTILPHCALLSTDGYILDRNSRFKKRIWNGDDPQAINMKKILSTIDELCNNSKLVNIYGYNHASGKTYLDKQIPGGSFKFLIIDGSCTIYNEIRERLSILILLDASNSVRRKLRFGVDTTERGYNEIDASYLWDVYSKNYDLFVAPYINCANILINVNLNRKYCTHLIRKCYCI